MDGTAHFELTRVQCMWVNVGRFLLVGSKNTGSSPDQRRREQQLWHEVQARRAEYLRILDEADSLAGQIREGNHEYQAPDGIQSIRRLGTERTLAFQKY